MKQLHPFFVHLNPHNALYYTDRGLIVYVDLGEGCYRLAGTALSAVYQQAGRPFQPRKEKNGVGEGGEGENEFRTDHDEAGMCMNIIYATYY